MYVSLKLSDWWTNVAYLEFRQPVTVNVSPGVVFPKQNYTDKEGQLRYNQCHYISPLCNAVSPKQNYRERGIT